MTATTRWWTPARLSTPLRLDDAAWTENGDPVWIEGRSDRSTLVRSGAHPCELTPDHSVRAGVGYGGGDFCLAKNLLLFVQRSGPLLSMDLNGKQANPVMPRFGSVASPTVSPDGTGVLCVHSLDNTDVIAYARLDGVRWPTDLVRGADFYMQPAWHPDSRRIAWVEWNHPDMPWDGARLMEARLDGNRPDLVDPMRIAGGTGKPVYQPCWSPNGNHLAWIESDGEQYLLRLRDETTLQIRTLAKSLALLPPAWVQGGKAIAWKADSSGLRVIDSEAGRGRILSIGLDGTASQIDPGPYGWFSQITPAPTGDAFLVVASSPSIPDRIAMWKDGIWQTVAKSTAEDVPEDAYPVARSVSWLVGDQTVHGILFEPRTGAPAQGRPLLVNVHGGPTSARSMNFSADTCFFTDRGWAVLEVNYRGSTGYGEAYRLSLNGQWGEMDTLDCVEGAKAMVSQRIADPSRLVIKGGSAGGFTVLNALAHHPGVFRAGISNYGVTDLAQLEATTHKFEARYLDRLVGPLPAEKQRYHDRSPVHFAHQIRDALAVFQGSDDKVVPLEQAESIVAALKKAGTPHHYRVFEGEGHGWRRAETIETYYKEVESFLEAHAS
ncbi:MAG: prolyl oligopeptidase family serine peptidase [Fibrobacterota bacterium]